MQARCDVFVIGGGLAGLVCAWQCAALGARTILTEAVTFGHAASSRNAGIYMPGRDPESMSHLYALAQASDLPLEILHTGHLSLATSPETHEQYQAEFERQVMRPTRRISLLSREECEDLLGIALNPSIKGGRWYPSATVIDPVALVQALIGLAKKAGSTLLGASPARSLTRMHGEWRVTGPQLDVHARSIIVAAGSWTSTLTPRLAPFLTTARAQMLQTQPMDRRLFRPACAYDFGRLYWRQLPNLSIIVGGMREHDTDNRSWEDDAVTAPVQKALEIALTNVSKSVPAFKVEARWGALMDISSDGRPIVGHIDAESSIWVICGFNGHGLPRALSLAPRLAATIVNQESGLLPADLAPDRFDGLIEMKYDVPSTP